MNIIVNKMFLGLVPATDKIKELTTLATLYFDNAAAKVKPPIKTMITELHIELKISLEASGPDITVPSAFFNIAHDTMSNGINIDVVYKGRASDAHKIAQTAKTAKLACCTGSFNVGTHMRITNATIAIKSLMIWEVKNEAGIGIDFPNKAVFLNLM